MFRLVTPVNDEFQRWLFYELANDREWNKDLISHKIIGPNSWEFKMTPKDGSPGWSIRYHTNIIVVESKLSRFQLRQDLTFDMGNAQVIVGGQR